jgi:hypothetical protein
MINIPRTEGVLWLVSGLELGCDFETARNSSGMSQHMYPDVRLDHSYVAAGTTVQSIVINDDRSIPVSFMDSSALNTLSGIILDRVDTLDLPFLSSSELAILPQIAMLQDRKGEVARRLVLQPLELLKVTGAVVISSRTPMGTLHAIQNHEDLRALSHADPRFFEL